VTGAASSIIAPIPSPASPRHVHDGVGCVGPAFVVLSELRSSRSQLLVDLSRGNPLLHLHR
jgi:hypothetical protein